VNQAARAAVTKTVTSAPRHPPFMMPPTMMPDELDGPAPEMPELPPAPGGGGEQTVPVRALSVPGEGEELTPPAPGDRVSYTVEGRVSRIDGDMAYVTAESINGEPIEAATEPAGEMDAYAALEAEAGQMGSMM